jgi:hypothetical protein
MAPQGARQYHCPFNAQIDSAIFDRRDTRLWNARKRGELRLAQLLKLAQAADRFAYCDFNTFFGRTKVLHITNKRAKTMGKKIGLPTFWRPGDRRWGVPDAPNLDSEDERMAVEVILHRMIHGVS